MTTITGDGSCNILIGTNAGDVINANGGNDTVLGGNGNDTIDGGTGNDMISGGNGEDTLNGDAGNDTICGGNGEDTLNGGSGNDTLSGDNGDDTIIGGSGNDIICGGNGDDTLSGGVGNDLINGGRGTDTAIFAGTYASYTITPGFFGSLVVSGQDGTDIVVAVEWLEFADGLYDVADGVFTPDVAPVTADYSWTTQGVEVDLVANTATGADIPGGTEPVAASVVNVIGGSGDDILRGDPGDNQLFGGAGNDLLTGGLGGNDLFDGGSGNDRVSFSGAVNSVNVQLAAGVATIGAFTKTLQSIELVRGTAQDDTYDATAFSGASANAGSSGTFNEFEGLDGDDTITGNGNTRVSYLQALAGVNVNLGTGSAVSLLGGDAAGIGTDTFTGVNAARGSEFDDELRGGTGNDTLIGGGGNDFLGGGAGSDTLNGGAGFDTASYGMASGPITADLAAGTVIAGPDTDTLIGVEAINGSAFNDTLRGDGIDNTLNGNDGNDFLVGRGGNDILNGGNGIDIARFSGVRSEYTITPGGVPGSSTVADNVAGRNGTDTLTGVELTEFDNTYMLNQRVLDLSTFGGLAAGKQILGTNLNNGGVGDNLTLGLNASGRFIDLAGGGTDTLTLQAFGSPVYNLNLANVESLVSTGGDDTVNLQNVAVGMSIDLGGGADTLNLANGNNDVTVLSTFAVNGGTGDDTVRFVAEVGVVNQEINLGTGTNVLYLQGDEDTLNLFVSGANLTIVGQTSPVTGGNETLTLLNQQLGTTIDLAAGANDTLFLATPAMGTNDVTVSGVEFVTGGSAFDMIRIVNDLGTTQVTAGFGADWIVAGDSFDEFRFTSVQDSYVEVVQPGSRDVVENFETSDDTFVFAGISGFVSNIDYIDTAAFSGGGDNSEARLSDLGGGFSLIEIDVDGDGTIGANDMTIELLNLNGTLSNGDFLLV